MKYLVSVCHRWQISEADYLLTVLSLVPLPVQGGCGEFRRVPVPPHRFSPLKEHWMKIFTPIVEHLKLQIRLNLKKRHVELRVGGRS